MAVKYVKDFEFSSAPGRAKYAGGGRTSYADLPYAERVAKSRAESDARMAASRQSRDAGKPSNEKVTAMRAALDAKIAANRQASDAKEAARRAAAQAARKPPAAPTRNLRPAPTMTIMPVPMQDDEMMMAKKGGKVEKVMREYKEGKLHSGSKKGPAVKNRKQAVAIALSEARRMKKADGGKVDDYGNKKEPFRGSPKKARELGRKDRMDRIALEKMRKAEKYAPGLSIDMPDRKAHLGMPKARKMMYGGGKC